ncbi:MAG: Gfo/Idh/MocA family oxidoreductase [Dehalococcoidia bacterium]|jgi:predicted dehydrogenase|nr:Gfo/Idh/MocA family oxidoreductase [Dehalococcoidia bacterium]
MNTIQHLQNLQKVRVGMVGAGTNSRARHIPGFQVLEGVEVIGVANRSRESSQRVADEFGMSHVFENWHELVQSPDIDAVCIGTWPYMHCPITLSALNAGKHVLTEARMAMDASEARAMLQASRRNPQLVAQVVPSPFTLKVDRTIQDMIGSGYLGSLNAIELRVTQRDFPEFGGPFQWRHDRSVSGYNLLFLGVWYEALMRWVGPATEVSAMTKVTVPQRVGTDGLLKGVTVPDHVEVLCQFAGGAQAHLAFSAVTGLSAAGDVWLFGTEGTLNLDTVSMTLSGGRRGDHGLKEISISPEKQETWRVEEEFINAIRGLEPVRLTTFEDGLAYMEFTEAVTRSAQERKTVSLPL